MMRKFRHLFFLCLVGVMLASCNTAKRTVYLQNMQLTEEYPFAPDRVAIVQPNDLLGITVNCRQPELALPFNTRSGAVSVDGDGTIVSQSGSLGRAEDSGYRVDNQGYILFPIIGKIHVGGHKLSQVSEIIKDLLVAGDYIKDPHVSVEILNFKYTVLGAVGKTGTFNVDGTRITLLEAIANAGDLSSAARVDNVKVIREEDGKRVVLAHDLRGREMFDSPFFYLKPNDIVYVEYKRRAREGSSRGLQYASMALSLTSAVTYMLWILK